MNQLQRLLLTLCIITLSLALGYITRRVLEPRKGWERLLPTLRKILQNAAINFLIPISAMLSLWGLPQPEPDLLFLPLLGLVAYVWGGGLAILASRCLKYSNQDTGALFCCGTFTNLAAVGALVCLMFLGENTIALVVLYRLLEEIYYFGVSFPVARWYGEKDKKNIPASRAFRLDPLLALIVCALLLGICLNLAGVPRAPICGTIASSATLIATIFLLFAIGMTLRFSHVLCYIRQGAVICGIKFLGVPLLIIPLAWLAGYAAYEQGIAFKVVIILSAMPVAMTALVPPAMFNLNVDLANACWMFSTLGLVIILPLLSVLLKVM